MAHIWGHSLLYSSLLVMHIKFNETFMANNMRLKKIIAKLYWMFIMSLNYAPTFWVCCGVCDFLEGFQIWWNCLNCSPIKRNRANKKTWVQFSGRYLLLLSRLSISEAATDLSVQKKIEKGIICSILCQRKWVLPAAILWHLLCGSMKKIIKKKRNPL